MAGSALKIAASKAKGLEPDVEGGNLEERQDEEREEKITHSDFLTEANQALPRLQVDWEHIWTT